MIAKTKITRQMFIEATGEAPQNDDLERCNCKRAGQRDHTGCGWNYEENLPCSWVGQEKGKLNEKNA